MVTNIDFDAWGDYLGDPPLAMDDGAHAVLELDGDDEVFRRNFYGPGLDQLLAAEFRGSSSSTLLWTLSDQQNTVRDLLMPIWEYVAIEVDFDAFGRPNGDVTSPVIQHAGRTYDAETGLYYNRTRMYDPLARGGSSAPTPSASRPATPTSTATSSTAPRTGPTLADEREQDNRGKISDF